MQLLKSLARRHGMHAYVLPGGEPGKSIGCFKVYPTRPDGLEPFILLGENRNISTFNIRNRASKPSKFSASHLNVSDKSIKTAKSSFRDAEMLGVEPALVGGAADAALQILRNSYDYSKDLDMVVSAEAANSSYSFEATGKVDSCYPSILQPYRVVTIMGVNGRLSGDYLITKATHTLKESDYIQSFTVIRNARSAGSGSTGGGGGISAAAGGGGGIEISGSISLGGNIF
jgi:hypothetical protein